MSRTQHEWRVQRATSVHPNSFRIILSRRRTPSRSVTSIEFGRGFTTASFGINPHFEVSRGTTPPLSIQLQLAFRVFLSVYEALGISRAEQGLLVQQRAADRSGAIGRVGHREGTERLLA